MPQTSASITIILHIFKNLFSAKKIVKPAKILCNTIDGGCSEKILPREKYALYGRLFIHCVTMRVKDKVKTRALEPVS